MCHHHVLLALVIFFASDFADLAVGQVVEIASQVKTSVSDERAADSVLLDKLYACAAAVHIANAMGENVEGKSFGSYEYFDQFPPGRPYAASFRENSETYDSVRKAKVREPAMGEDGCERFRWVASSFVRKGGPIDMADLAHTIRHDIDPDKFGYLIGWQDQFLYYSIILGLPPQHVGEFASWPGFIGTDKMLGAAVGMMNAGDPAEAARQARNLGLLKDVPSGDGNWALDVCAAHAAALAEAFRAGATVERMVDAALEQLSPEVRREVEDNLRVAKSVADWRDLGPHYAKQYDGRPISRAEEVLSRGLSCFLLAEGDPARAIIYAANLGRDTDCCCYVAGTLAAALKGTEALPREWINAVNRQIETCPYTNNRRNSWENALGFYRAIKGRASSATIDEIVREHLKMPENAPLTTEDYRRVRSLEANGRYLKSLEGIEKLTQIEWLNLGNNGLSDLTFLADLTSLRFLDLSGNQVTSLRPLSQLMGLQELLLDRNRITSLAPLSDLEQLRRLNLAHNRISNLAPLAEKRELTSLFLEDNRVADLNPLAGAMDTLVVLNVSHNQVEKIAPLKDGKTLVGLYLQGNRIADLTPLIELSSRIKCLDLSDNRVSDAAPLEALRTLIQLDVGSNRIESVDGLAKLGSLSYLDLRENQIKKMSPVAALTKLKVLYLSGNSGTDARTIAPLRDQLLLKDF